MGQRMWNGLLLTAAVLSFCSCSLVPPPHPGSYADNILFIGTSDTWYNDGLNTHLQNMAAVAVPPLYETEEQRSAALR